MLFKKTLSRYSLSKEESRKISGPISSKSSKPTSRPYNINKNPTSSSLNFSEGSGTMSCHQNASNGPKSTFYLIIKQNWEQTWPDLHPSKVHVIHKACQLPISAQRSEEKLKGGLLYSELRVALFTVQEWKSMVIQPSITSKWRRGILEEKRSAIHGWLKHNNPRFFGFIRLQLVRDKLLFNRAIKPDNRHVQLVCDILCIFIRGVLIKWPSDRNLDISSEQGQEGVVWVGV